MFAVIHFNVITLNTVDPHYHGTLLLSLKEMEIQFVASGIFENLSCVDTGLFLKNRSTALVI